MPILFEPRTIQDGCTLDRKKIEIWIGDLSQDLPTNHMAYLDETERLRLDRLQFPTHKHRFMMSRVYAKTILGAYLDISPCDITFDYHTQGKPYLAHAPELMWNMSHSENKVCIAVGKETPVGIDISYFSYRRYIALAKALFDLPRHCEAAQQPWQPPFSEDTVTHLQNTIVYYQPYLFFQCFTQHEAYLKACGLGLYSPVRERIDWNWKYDIFMPEVLCIGTLCYKPSVDHVYYYELSFK